MLVQNGARSVKFASRSRTKKSVVIVSSLLAIFL
jgi:hypothetical protein